MVIRGIPKCMKLDVCPKVRWCSPGTQHKDSIQTPTHIAEKSGTQLRGGGGGEGSKSENLWGITPKLQNDDFKRGRLPVRNL